ncbi:MAG: DsbA family oxidoreductase [Thermomicrobiales bacterium]
MFIQVVQDIVCPWCRIGHHNLNSALDQWVAQGHERPDVQWFPYQLDPIEPHAGEKFAERLVVRKGMQPEQIATMFDRVIEAGTAICVQFRFDKIELAQNTVLAHQLIALTPPDRQDAVVEALHAAYFDEGKNVEDVAVLIESAGISGASADELVQIEGDLKAGSREADVLAMIEQARAAGVTGVPFFIIDGHLSLSGAQPAAVILQALEQVASQPVG